MSTLAETQLDGLDAEALFSAGVGLTFDDLIILPGYIDFPASDVRLDTNITRNIRIKRPDRSGHRQAFRNNVLANTAVDPPDRYHDRRTCQVRFARDDHLQTCVDLRRDRDRVDAVPRIRSVRLFPVYFDRDPVAGGHEAFGLIADLAYLGLRVDVDTKYRVDLRIVHHAFLYHVWRAAGFASGRTFFRGLKDENDCAFDLIFHSGKNGSSAKQHRDVRIVPACMHHADLLAVEFRGFL